MSDRRVEELIRCVVELDDLLATSSADSRIIGPGRRSTSAARWIGSLAVPVAAALAWAFLLPSEPQMGVADGADAPELLIDHLVHADDSESVVTTFRPCADEEAYAIVLLRAWNDECQCLMWRLYEFADGTALARLNAGEDLRVPIDAAGAPSIEQAVLFAIARSRDDLPDEPGETEELLECLNNEAPPTLPGQPDGVCASALSSCLPSVVRVHGPSVVPP